MIDFLRNVGDQAKTNVKEVFTRRLEGEVAGSYAVMTLVGGIIISGLFLRNGNPLGAEIVSAGTLLTCYKVENALPILRKLGKDAIEVLKRTN